MRMLGSFIVIGVLLVPAAAGDAVDRDQKNLQGLWRVVRSIDAGIETPQEGEDITVVVFDGSVIKVREGDKSHDMFQFRLLPKTDPKEINLRLLFGRRKGERNEGIYHLDGKNLKICVQDDPTKKRPTAFESKAGSTHKLIVLKKL